MSFDPSTFDARNGPAGAKDGVAVKDFAIFQRRKSDSSDDVGLLDKRNVLTRAPSVLIRQVAKKAGWQVWRTRAHDVLHPWLYNGHLPSKGHRTSVAPAGVVKYPELEPIPGGI